MALLTAPSLRTRSEGMDCLRAILALWVLIAHAIPWAITAQSLEPSWVQHSLKALIRVFQPNGETHPAVLCFIVLSGYCIHRAGARAGAAFPLKPYAMRRAFRIVPVYLLACLAGFACYALSSGLDASLASKLTATPSLKLSGIFTKLSGISAFYAPLHLHSWQGNAPLTTVMVEIWLYIFYALAILLIRNRREASWLIVMGSAYMAAFLWVYHHPEYAAWWHNGSIYSFLPYWWIGAYFVREPLHIRHFIVLIVLSILGWTALTIFSMNDLFISEARKLTWAIMCGLIIHRLDHLSWNYPKALTTFGGAGYSIYAFHAPFLILLLIAQIPIAIAIVITIASSCIIYKSIERPLHIYGRRLTNSTHPA